MNSFGRIFRVSIYGESHGSEVGVMIDGCPAGMPLADHDFFTALSRRRPGMPGTTSRTEKDIPLLKSGVYRGYTSGTPILISFTNENTISQDYRFDGFFRPGHADFTSHKKYRGYNDPNGSGHFSGRLTIGLVAAGVIAMKLIPEYRIEANLISAGGSKDIERAIMEAQNSGDSVGGVVECRISNLPAGLGEPFFDSVESLISHAVFAIPGAKAVEFGDGLESANATGSEFNDLFEDISGKTSTNHAGGINGGISNGNDVVFRVFFKPASSIAKTQKTLNFNTNAIDEFNIRGRHDACYALRTPVVVESIAAIVLADLKLIAGL
ncbi:MAG: chorismate synthase [Bacteroidales bacterium]|nr:chorismate synthase [Bacteroidales bacterium]